MSKSNAAKKEAEVASTETAETTVEVVTLTPAQAKKIKELNHWSEKFRYLASEGLATKDIARITGKRYQQVRNTLVTPLKPKAKA